MDIDQISVALRRRRGWEAVDLGFTLVRTWRRPIWMGWLITVVPVAVFLNFVLSDYPGIAALAVWWLKPAFDRVILSIVSRGLFAGAPASRDILRHPFRFWGAVYGGQWWGIFAALTWRRFSLWRSYTMPVDQLEGVSKGTRRDRVRVLTRAQMDVSIGLHSLCTVCELGLYLLLFAFLALLVPEESNIDVFSFAFPDSFTPDWVPFACNAVWLGAISIIEPFYVGAGFALYINRRVDLEGWDLELEFRRMRRRIQGLKAGTLAAALLAALGLSWFLHTPFAWAEKTTKTVVESSEDVEVALKRVLELPELQEYKEEWQWKQIEEEIEDDDYNPMEDEISAFGRGVGSLMATLLKWGLVLAAVVFLVHLLTLLRKMGKPSMPKRTRPDAPETLFGLDVRPESLPDNIIDAVRRLWATDPVGALSLLYRGILVHLIDTRGVEIPISATEGECVKLVSRRVSEDMAADFELVTRAWQETAYAERLPRADTFGLLCGRWAAHLTTPPPSEPSAQEGQGDEQVL